MKSNSTPSASAEIQEVHSLPLSVFLHLFPGLLIAGFYLLVAGHVMDGGWPPLAAMLLAILCVALPVELGELLRRGRRQNGSWSLRGILGNQKPLPAWQYLAFTLGFLVLAFFLSGATGILEGRIGAWLSQWLPEWFFLSNMNAYAAYSKTILWWTLAGNLILNGLAAPIVEELYFRGFLLPRLSRFGGWAPIINAALFTFYHFWQPYAYLSVLIVLTPLVYLVWRKQNLMIGILAHCALNIAGNLLLFAGILGN